MLLLYFVFAYFYELVLLPGLLVDVILFFM